MFVLILLAVLVLFALILIFSSIKVISQSNVYIVERFGSYKTTLSSGLQYIVPFVDRVARKLDIREQVINFEPQPVITKDNVTMRIDTVIFVMIVDPVKYCYGVGNPMSALENLTATTLRNIIGDLELDSTLTSRDVINTKIRITLDEATDAWGLKVTRVEVKNIIPPQDIQQAMEKQMRAEREKREKILIAEGNKTKEITEAEGMKQATILRAEAKKQESILLAEGEALALLKVQEAHAKSLDLLNNSQPCENVLKLKGFEALTKIGEGKSTKLIIPSDLGNIASLSSIFKETTNLIDEKKEEA
ncbi:MAG: SPFH domain-containing protein [Mycoplasmatales bacterium]